MIKRLALLLVVLGGSFLLAATAQANVNNFFISDYKIDYQLSRDAEDRSVLKTTETITAQFPATNQNHGLERAIPKKYDGHSLSLKIKSVTNQRGEKLNYTTYGDSNDNTIVRIGDKDKYVHGKNTYVIKYTQADVTKSFSQSKNQEFYWDTNGTDWKVPILKLSVNLTVDKNLAERLNSKTACYQGGHFSTSTCKLTKNNNQFSAQASGLSAGDNMTVAIGFNQGTFAEYQTPLLEKLFGYWLAVQVALIVISVGLITWLSIRYYKKSNRSREQKPIAPEYLPPKSASVEVSSRLLGSSPNSFTAQIIDLAVRHYLKIYQTKEQTSIFSPAEYEIEIIRSLDDLRPEEKEIISDIFNGQTKPGSRLEMKELKKDTTLYKRLQDNPKKLKDLVRGSYGLRHKVPQQSAWFTSFGKWALLAAVLLLSPSLLLVSLLAFGFGHTLWPLTDKGLDLVRYLKGLKMYIKVAETERLKMLQSPKGAAKVSVNVNDKKQLVKLYEKVLPYAVLFGQEKDWNKQLGKYYETTNSSPDWYAGAVGASAFNASSFTTAMSNFSNSASSSSGSSGSSGGGYSGGGGGGGGGGGW